VRAPRLGPGATGRALALALLLLGCRPAPVASPGPDASVAGAVCANLAHFDCALGSDPACASRLEISISEQRVLASELACARSATTKAELVACSPYFACP
jgi:hypothetical protein